MAKLLLDSSNTSLSVGIELEGKLLDSISYESWQSQSEHMVPEIDNILKKHNLTRKDIDGVVSSIGPGSYTGVRIALTIAKIIALALDVPLFTVSSLRVLKDNDKPSICVINARSGRSYFGVYQGQEIIVGDTIKKNDEILQYIKEHPDYSVCGDARYLGLGNVDTNISLQMVSLISSFEKEENPLASKPIYMKD